ncbi:hypothetical protein AB0A63_31635 [Lentzea sp. NPDC042327]|uniref:hypothetical protein n=1 Tax=Lentzea sp. NPDC042327 TaxID=3154801 RepID=UPI0033FFB1DF
MTAHDPLGALGEPLPTPSPWESLARHARWLAEYAEKAAATDPIVLAPIDDRDFLAELDERALAIRGIAAACRRHTYQTLREQGVPVAGIAQAWGVSAQAVYKVLSGPKK